MAITVGAAAQQTVQALAQENRSAKSQTQSADTQSGGGERNAAVRATLTPALKQAAHLVAGPLGEVAVTMAAGAVGALLDTRA